MHLSTWRSRSTKRVGAMWSGTSVLLMAAVSAWAGTTYHLTELSFGLDSTGTAINDSGQVTGGADLPDGTSHAFLWDGAVMQDLGTFGGSFSHGHAINDSGQVTGGADLPDGTSHAFLWDGAVMQDLGTLGGTASTGVAVNDSGQVTGDADLPDGTSHAFLWDGAVMQDLGTLLGGSFSYGAAINDSGQVTGATNIDGTLLWHAFLSDGAVMQDFNIGFTTGRSSFGRAINDSGHVTGYANVNGILHFHAFLWDGPGTGTQDLGTLGGGSSGGTAINASGQVTGASDTTANCFFSLPWDTRCNGNPHAFLWDHATLHDLNTLIDPADPLQPFVTLTFGNAINDAGQIVADGIDSRTNQTHAYFLTPFLVPSGLQATATKRSIDLAWQDNSGNEDGFRIERRSATGAWEHVADTAADVPTYSDISIARATTYEYRVSAFGPGGSSTASPSATAQLPKQDSGGGGAFGFELEPLLLALLALRRRRRLEARSSIGTPPVPRHRKSNSRQLHLPIRS